MMPLSQVQQTFPQRTDKSRSNKDILDATGRIDTPDTLSFSLPKEMHLDTRGALHARNRVGVKSDKLSGR